MSEFNREDRYIVLKLNRLPKDEVEYLRDCHPKAMVECVVVEHDWPEYQLVWTMIEHRMAGKPVPNFNDWRRADELQQRLTAADERADVLEGLLRLARGAIGENQWTLLTKDIDAMLSQDAQRTNNSANAHCPHDGICHTSEETCVEAQARIASLTAPAGAGQ